MKLIENFKVMISEEMSKPIKKDNNLLNEQPTGKELSKMLKSGASEAQMIGKLATFFKIDANAVKLALAKDATTLTNELKSAISKDIKSGFKSGTTNTLGPLTKNASKMKTIQEIMRSGELSEKEIIAIIERNKTEASNLVRSIESKTVKGVGTKTAQGEKVIEGGKVKQTGENSFNITANNGSTVNVTANFNSTPQQALKTLDDQSKTLTGEAKVAAEESKQMVKELSNKPKVWEKIKRISKKLNNKWLWALGLLGGGYLLYKFFFGDKKGTPKLSSCMINLAEQDGVNLLPTTTGDIVVMVPKTGNSEYDSKKGLKFYPNGRVLYGDNSKRGSWSCKSGEFKLTEQVDGANDILKDIVITWDADRSTTPTTPTTQKPVYFDCSDQDFPFRFGCINPKIAQIQTCLGITPNRGYFGPKTLRTLIDVGFEMQSKTITQKIYNVVMANCGENSSQTAPEDDFTAPKLKRAEMPKSENPKSPDLTPKSPNLNPKSPNLNPTQSITPEDYYANVLKTNYLYNESNRIKYRGPVLDANNLGLLDAALAKRGYVRIKQKPKPGDKVKYVWEKQKQ